VQASYSQAKPAIGTAIRTYRAPLGKSPLVAFTHDKTGLQFLPQTKAAGSGGRSLVVALSGWTWVEEAIRSGLVIISGRQF
jgi:hypothetical protein